MKEKNRHMKNRIYKALKISLKWAGGVLAGLLAVVILAAASLYLPPVQRFVVRQAARFASESTGMTIGVEKVRLCFPLDLSLEGVLVAKADSAGENRPDTIAHIDRIKADVAMLPLFRGMVNIDGLSLQGMEFDTYDLVAQAVVAGCAGELSLASHGVNLLKSLADVDEVILSSARVDVQLVDTVTEDTTESENAWKINLKRVLLSGADVTLHMPGDSLVISAGINSAEVLDGRLDLENGTYALGSLALDMERVRCDNPYVPATDGGIDFNHINLNTLSLSADSVFYGDAGQMYLHLAGGAFREACGLELTHLGGTVRMDTTALYVDDLGLFTTGSDITLSGRMALTAFDENDPGELSLTAKAELGRSDVLLFLSGMPEEFLAAYPYYPLTVTADVSGTVKNLSLNSVGAFMPSVFSASLSGRAGNLLDTSGLYADVDLDFTAYNISFLTSSLLGQDGSFAVPSGTRISGSVTADGGDYKARLKLSEGGGEITAEAECGIPPGSGVYPDFSYSAFLSAKNFPVGDFVKGLDLSPLTLEADISGAGGDVFDARTRLSARAEINRLNFSGFDLDGSSIEAGLENGIAALRANCVNDIVSGEAAFDAIVNSDDIRGTLACNVTDADLRALGACDVPLNASLCAHVDLETDLDECHMLKGYLGDVYLRDSASVYRARDLEIDALTRPDTTWLALESGDLDLRLAARGGYKTLASAGGNLTDEFVRQAERKYISQDTLLALLPAGHLSLHSGRGNFVYGFAKRMGYDFRGIDADIDVSPSAGVNGHALIDSLSAFGVEVDTLRFEQQTLDGVFHYTLQARNGPGNPDYNFNLLLDGSLFATGSNLRCRLYDENGNLGINLALLASLESGGIRVSLTDKEQVLGYEKFETNEHNYIFLNDDGRIYADLRLVSEKGTGLAVYSDNGNRDALQDITLGIYNLDLAPIAAVVPYCPEIKGVLSGDFHAIQTREEFSLSSTVGVDGLEYEGVEMGDLGSEFVYMPLDDGGHYLDALLSYNGRDVGTVKGTYTPGEKDDYLSADATLNGIPLNLVDGFIPDMIIGLKGYGAGSLKVDGTLSDIRINGTIDLDSAYLVSVPYGVELAIDERPVTIKDSKLLLEDFRLFSHNDEPLTINGEIDCTDLANMETNLRLTARNWLVIDSKEDSRRSEAYGKAYVNLDAMASGPLASLKIIGKLDVLGSTDVTYILRDSPLSTDNAMEGLVEFTDFSSGEEPAVTRPVVGGPYIDLRLSVAKDARIFCALNATKTNYLDMTGGGDLRMTYSDGDIRLTGRYTVEEGQMKYSLPVIPLKTFTIAEGSYVEFTGDVMDPALSITATETTKANATVDGVSQSVTFECGVEISQTLSNMGLAFVIEAPENMTIDSELRAMAADERNKVAVTMLTTGMYLSEGNLSSFSMNSALSSFLQSEINNISNSALRTLDLSVGIDNTTDATGDTHTDYSFKFSKRLWNNRVRITVGGKVSSNNASMESLFDNVAFEYRLDRNSYTNLRLFYDRATYDYLEGYVGQYGVGVAWKRQIESFRELLRKNGGEDKKRRTADGDGGTARETAEEENK